MKVAGRIRPVLWMLIAILGAAEANPARAEREARLIQGLAAPAASKAAALAQDYVNRHALGIADDGLQIFGGHGYIRDLPLEMWLRNARVLTIHNALAAA